MNFSEGTVVAGRYRLEAPIGEGAMGSVFRAHDETLNRAVAIKLLFVDGARDPEEKVQQFLREARIAASVQHRNVIQTIDFGTIDKVQPYMVMELLSGCSLSDRMEAGRLPDEHFLPLMSLTLRGLSAVHDAGIVHRDLKPDNIFLRDDPEGVFPKILDFGISRSLASEERKSAIATQQGLIMGTPDYMSPEQARGESNVDKRADIYAMGAIMYEGLTGRLPFLANMVGELIVQIVTKAPTPLSELRPDLAPAVVAVVEQAMKKRASERFDDARAMRQALNSAIEMSVVAPLPVAPRPAASPVQVAPAANPLPVSTAPVSEVATGSEWGAFEGLGEADDSNGPARPLSIDPAAISARAPATAVRLSGQLEDGNLLETSVPPPVPGSKSSPRSSDLSVQTGGRASAALMPSAAAPARGFANLDEESGNALELDYAWGAEYGQRDKGRASKASNQARRREKVRHSSRVVAARARSLVVPGLCVILVLLWVVGPHLVYSNIPVGLPELSTPVTIEGERPMRTSRRKNPGRHAPALRDVLGE